MQKGAQERLRQAMRTLCGRPRVHRERQKQMLTCREISQRLWCGDYKLLVKDALEADPEMAATCRTHLESNNAHYKRRLQKHSDPSALEVYVEKEDLRIAEWLSELDGASSQKCKTPFKEAKGIQAKIVRTGVAATGAASYEGENRPLRKMQYQLPTIVF